LLQISGNFASEDIVASTVALIGTDASTQAFGMHKLYWAAKDDLSQLALNHTTAWCLGEYAPMLKTACPESVGSHVGEVVTEMQVYEILSKMMRRHSSTDLTKAYVINAAFKLTERFREPEVQKKMLKILTHFSSSVHLELQARSCEYLALTKDQFAGRVRNAAMAPMPLPDVDALRRKREMGRSAADGSDSSGSDDSDSSGSDSDDSDDDSSRSKLSSKKSGKKAQRSRKPAGNGGDGGGGGGDLGGLLGLDFGGSGGSGGGSSGGGGNASTQSGGNGGGGAGVDLLDIFGGGGGGGAAAPAAPQASSSGVDDLLGMFGGGGGSSSPAPAAAASPDYPKINAYEKNGIAMTF
jgi:hypothetical protein